MPLTRASRIKEAWRHPVGHDLLLNMIRQTGRAERWLEGPLVANLPLHYLDRFAGPGFADLVVEMAGSQPAHAAQTEAERPVWWKESVIYHIYPPSFMDSDHDGMGDLAGISQRLPYLERLGVDTLWLWPVLQESKQSRGTRDFMAIRQDLGEVEDLEALAAGAHARGMRLVLGMDITCTSDDHPWFRETLAGERSNFYILREGSPDAPPNNWTRGTASAWRWVPELKRWGLNLCGHRQMDLNWDNPELRAEMQKVLRFWAEKGVDGFVLGPVNLLSKLAWDDGNPVAAGALGGVGYEKYAYGPRLHRYLHELRDAAPAPVLLAGETRGVSTEMAKLFTGDCRGELDMVFDDSHLAARHRPRGDEGDLEPADLKKYYLRWMEYYGSQNWMSLFLEGPDMPRIVSRLGASALYRSILAKMLGTMMLTLRGTPVVYQGSELGLPNTRFNSAEELRSPTTLRRYREYCEKLPEREALQRVVQACCDHARTPMPWSPGETAGFTGAQPWMRLADGTDHLNTATQMDDASSVWNHYRQLIALRRRSPGLVYGTFNPVFVKNRRVFCYFRILEGEKWYVEINLTEREVPRPGRILASQKLALSNYDNPYRALRPYEANIYKCD